LYLLNTNMKIFFKAILGVVVIGSFIGLLAYGLNYLQKPGPLENIEKRMDEAAKKESVLTDSEIKLKQESQNKEWEEVDK